MQPRGILSSAGRLGNAHAVLAVAEMRRSRHVRSPTRQETKNACYSKSHLPRQALARYTMNGVYFRNGAVIVLCIRVISLIEFRLVDINATSALQ